MKTRHYINRRCFVKITTYALFTMLAAFNAYLIAQPDSMILNNMNIFKKKERPTVAFPHGLHMQAVESCLACHHRYVNRKNVLKEEELTVANKNIRCSICHGKKQINGRYALMDAFHLQCSGCHRSRVQQENKSGPIMCGQCHRL